MKEGRGQKLRCGLSHRRGTLSGAGGNSAAWRGPSPKQPAPETEERGNLSPLRVRVSLGAALQLPSSQIVLCIQYGGHYLSSPAS